MNGLNNTRSSYDFQLGHVIRPAFPTAAERSGFRNEIWTRCRSQSSADSASSRNKTSDFVSCEHLRLCDWQALGRRRRTAEVGWAFSPRKGTPEGNVSCTCSLALKQNTYLCCINWELGRLQRSWSTLICRLFNKTTSLLVQLVNYSPWTLHNKKGSSKPSWEAAFHTLD